MYFDIDNTCLLTVELTLLNMSSLCLACSMACWHTVITVEVMDPSRKPGSLSAASLQTCKQCLMIGVSIFQVFDNVITTFTQWRWH